jgi:hypothetical protein
MVGVIVIVSFAAFSCVSRIKDDTLSSNYGLALNDCVTIYFKQSEPLSGIIVGGGYGPISGHSIGAKYGYWINVMMSDGSTLKQVTQPEYGVTGISRKVC